MYTIKKAFAMYTDKKADTNKFSNIFFCVFEQGNSEVPHQMFITR